MVGINVLGDAVNGCVAESKFVELKGNIKIRNVGGVVDTV